jgi:hypothetical protein
MSKLRRIIGLTLLLLALAGCSMVRLAYDQAPNLVYWWIDGYVDVNGEQAPKLRDAVDGWFAWHRRSQLPEIAGLLARAQREVLEPSTAAHMCAWSAEAERRLDAALQAAVPAAAELMLTLTPEQLLHVERRMAKDNEEARADFLQADVAERQAASFKRTLGRFETLYGRLDATQREHLAAMQAASTFDPERWLGERRSRQRETLQALTMVSTAARNGGDREAVLRQAEAAVRVVVERSMRSPRPEYRAYQQRLKQDNCLLAANMHNAMTPAQRQAARAKLKGWEDDVRSLMAAGTSFAARGNGAAASR